jgi:hypothetical protein
MIFLYESHFYFFVQVYLAFYVSIYGPNFLTMIYWLCSGLILLKMLSEYVDISKYLPSLSFEVVQRVVEILKLFNTRTCQLVLGAGAMQVIQYFISGISNVSVSNYNMSVFIV